MSFNEDEPRDEGGRWTGDGGGGGPLTGPAAGQVWQDSEGLALSEGENAAAINYAAGAAFTVNQELRGITPDMAIPQEVQAGIVNGLDSAIAKSLPTSADTVLYRGVPLDTGYTELEPGTIVGEPAFMSTTTDSSVAGDAMAGEGSVLEVQAPAGTRGLDMSNVYTEQDLAGMGAHAAPGEEVVLPRGSEMMVLEQRPASGTDLYPVTVMALKR